MGFLMFTILLMPVMLLYGLVRSIVEWPLPLFAPLAPVLEFLLTPEGFNIVMGILLGVNLLLLVILLVVLTLWKRSGRLSRAYVGSLRGPARFGAGLVNIVVILWAVWQFLLVLLCAICLVVQPLQYFTAGHADSQDPGHPLWGTWEVTSCAAITPSCALTQDELDGYLGSQVLYGGYDYKRDGETYTKTQLFLTGDTEYQITSVTLDEMDAEEFATQFQLSAAGLGHGSSTAAHFIVHFQGENSRDLLLGQEVFMVGDTLYLYHQGALLLTSEALFYGGS